jgi:hypothetical protein
VAGLEGVPANISQVVQSTNKHSLANKPLLSLKNVA